MHARKSAAIHGLKVLPGEQMGTFSAVVSVFNNVDLGGDRILPGAFRKSLDRWTASGDPIPVIWSHQWDDPKAHIGYVVEYEELMPGDDRLPEAIRELGGLWVKVRLDVEDVATYAQVVYRNLVRRSLKEFSFAYDIPVGGSRRTTDGVNELVELDVIEVGPTLKGMNPATQLLDVKSLAARIVAAADEKKAADGNSELTPADVESWLAAEVGEKRLVHVFIPKDDDQTRCSICELTRNTLGHLNVLSGGAEGEKANVTLAGSVEETLDAYHRAASDYARANDLGVGGMYAVWPEASYPDEARAVMLVEGWDDPPGEGVWFEFRFASGDDGITVESATPVEIEATVVPKARRKATARLVERAKCAQPNTIGEEVVEEDGTGEPQRWSVLLDALALELDSA